jgi:hypothetical protein
VAATPNAAGLWVEEGGKEVRQREEHVRGCGDTSDIVCIADLVRHGLHKAIDDLVEKSNCRRPG